MNVFPEISWFGKERLLRVPLFGTILKMTDYVPMKEANYQNTKEMLGKLIEKTQARSIGIFPEGTRTTTGQMNRFHRGFIYLLRTTKLNILPVTLNGFYSLKPKNLFYINFSAIIDVIVHKEIRYEDLKEKTDNEIIDQVKNTIESLYRK
jgi:1-acyl-sn-glycerol-3-phosphate acyltransferase